MTSELFVQFQEFFWMVWGRAISAGLVIYIVVSVIATPIVLLDRVPNLFQRRNSKERG